MNRLHKAFRTTKVNLNEFPKDVQPKFEQLYIDLEAAKADAVSSERTASIAAARAGAARARAQVAELNILIEASTYDKRIENERNWTVFKNSEGELIFEGITDRILRNATRAGLQQMGRQAGEDNVNLDMFESGEEDGPGEEPAR